MSCHSQLEPLCKTEISEFFQDVDSDRDGVIGKEELQKKLDQIYDDLMEASGNKTPSKPRPMSMISGKFDERDLEFG